MQIRIQWKKLYLFSSNDAQKENSRSLFSELESKSG